MECQWEKRWEQVFSIFIIKENEICASEHKFWSRSRMSVLRREVTGCFLTPEATFGPWVQWGAMLRNVSWEKRSEGINLLFRGKDHFLKVSCSIWGLEGEVINISFSSSRLWNKAQGINKRSYHNSCRQKSKSNGS